MVPSNLPPHRSRSPRASGCHRFAMTAVAVLGLEGFEACDLELGRSGPSYSIDTLRQLRATGLMPAETVFITGVDAFLDLPTWRSYPDILDACHFAVVTRPGHGVDLLRLRLPALGERFVDAKDQDALGLAFQGPGTRVFIVDTPTTDVSSTEIRRRLARRESLDGWVPDAVECYIRQHHLYEDAPAAL